MRTFVLGDIHGAYKALLQCLERSRFDREKDQLIALGDVCDGWPEVRQSIDELLKIKHLKYIIGNHDLWARDWALKGETPDIWLDQGGKNTIASYKNKPMPQSHVELLMNALPFVVYENKLFVHGGIDPLKPIEEQELETLVWDRLFLKGAKEISFWEKGFKYGTYDDIFLGHTTTLHYGSMSPLRFGNVWMIDTGAGWSGRLTIMDVASKKYWQSDPVLSLYAETEGRHS